MNRRGKPWTPDERRLAGWIADDVRREGRTNKVTILRVAAALNRSPRTVEGYLRAFGLLPHPNPLPLTPAERTWLRWQWLRSKLAGEPEAVRAVRLGRRLGRTPAAVLEAAGEIMRDCG